MRNAAGYTKGGTARIFLREVSLIRVAMGASDEWQVIMGAQTRVSKNRTDPIFMTCVSVVRAIRAPGVAN